MDGNMESMKFYTEQEARKIICDMIGDNLISLTMSQMGRVLTANIEYRDFKPQRIVRRHIEDIIPNIEVGEITRDFSDKNLVHALTEDQTVVYVQEPNGRLSPTTAFDYIREILQFVDFSKKINV